MRIGVAVDMVLQADPGDQRGAKYKIEQAFIGDSQYDEAWRKGQEYNHKAVKVVVVWL